MADAEVKLNFTASVEQARAAIAEIAAAMEKLRAEGGLMRPEDAALLNEMQGQLVAYKARVDELDAAYRALQASGGEANTAALEQIKELQQEVETLTRQQNALVDKVLELQVENNKLTETAEDATEATEDGEEAEREMGETGEHVYTTLKGAVGNFIKSLFAGKLAVRELGMAIKGLAYSTVVLGAIQLAMEGIMWAWEKIKGVFSASEEEMEAAEEAAKRAQDALDDAKRAAENAAREVQQLKRKLAEKEEAEALKATLAAITAEYVAQRDAVAATLSDIKEQAQVRARERAAEAAAKTGELDLELLGLEERFVSGDIGKRDYIVQKSEIEKRKREEARVAEVDSAEIARDAAEAERDRIREGLDASNEEIARLNALLSKQTDPDKADLERAKLDELGKRRNALSVELNAARGRFQDEWGRKFWGKLGYYDAELGDFVFNEGYGRETLNGAMRREFDDDLQEVKRLEERRRQMDERYRAQRDVADAAQKGARQYRDTARRLDEERKTAATLEGKARQADDAARRANDNLTQTMARTAREGGLDDRSSNIRLRTQLNAIDREEAAGKRRELDRAVKDVAKQVRAAGNSKNDTEDDAAAFRAVGDLLGAQGREIARYGVNVRDLIALCGKLNLGNENSNAKIKALDGELRALQRRVDKNLSRS